MYLIFQFFKEHYKEIVGREGFTIRPVLVRPKSRGSVTLLSRDPTRPPAIDPNYLSHPDDVATLVNGNQPLVFAIPFLFL